MPAGAGITRQPTYSKARMPPLATASRARAMASRLQATASHALASSFRRVISHPVHDPPPSATSSRARASSLRHGIPCTSCLPPPGHPVKSLLPPARHTVHEPPPSATASRAPASSLRLDMPCTSQGQCRVISDAVDGEGFAITSFPFTCVQCKLLTHSGRSC